jgi:hypothetical protein
MNIERFWERVDASGDCWEWTGGLIPDGYGHAYVNGKSRGAHRVAYEALVGPLPVGLQIDHLCRNRRCVNPDHMEPVTPRENTLRGYSRTAQLARRTTCVHGHDLADALVSRRGWRLCRSCRRASGQRRARLTAEQVIEARRRREGGETFRSIAADLGVSGPTILRACSRESWRHV